MDGSVSVQVCRQWIESAGSVTCGQFEWVQAYLLPPEAELYYSLLMGGFSVEALAKGFSAAIGLFVTGFCVGYLMSIMRRAR